MKQYIAPFFIFGVVGLMSQSANACRMGEPGGGFHACVNNNHMSSSSAPWEYYTAFAYSSKTGAFDWTYWQGQYAYQEGWVTLRTKCKKKNGGKRCDRSNYHKLSDRYPYLVAAMGENPKKAVGKQGRFFAFTNYMIPHRQLSEDERMYFASQQLSKCQSQGYINCQIIIY